VGRDHSLGVGVRNPPKRVSLRKSGARWLEQAIENTLTARRRRRAERELEAELLLLRQSRDHYTAALMAEDVAREEEALRARRASVRIAAELAAVVGAARVEAAVRAEQARVAAERAEQARLVARLEAAQMVESARAAKRRADREEEDRRRATEQARATAPRPAQPSGQDRFRAMLSQTPRPPRPRPVTPPLLARNIALGRERWEEFRKGISPSSWAGSMRGGPGQVTDGQALLAANAMSQSHPSRVTQDPSASTAGPSNASIGRGSLNEESPPGRRGSGLKRQQNVPKRKH